MGNGSNWLIDIGFPLMEKQPQVNTRGYTVNGGIIFVDYKNDKNASKNF